MGANMPTAFVCSALQMATCTRPAHPFRPWLPIGLPSYRGLLGRFFLNLTMEQDRRRDYSLHEEVISDVIDYPGNFHNSQRLHSKLATTTSGKRQENYIFQYLKLDHYNSIVCPAKLFGQV
jgi:hypothetical protein